MLVSRVQNIFLDLLRPTVQNTMPMYLLLISSVVGLLGTFEFECELKLSIASVSRIN